MRRNKLGGEREREEERGSGERPLLLQYPRYHKGVSRISIASCVYGDF
ncbi:MAG: hypothetical protein MJE68_24840 [Proteobacteria bacterium]|nr:hypothetical protein [Pseudomonadota bacterium]